MVSPGSTGSHTWVLLKFERWHVKLCSMSGALASLSKEAEYMFREVEDMQSAMFMCTPYIWL